MTLFSSLMFFLTCFFISSPINTLASCLISIPLYQRNVARSNYMVTSDENKLHRSSLYNMLKGNYVVYSMFGFPPQRNALLVDTGNDLLWLQCKPCINCFNQSELLYDPFESLSYKEIDCNSSKCYHEQNFIDDCEATIYGTSKRSCRFEYFYDDKSSSCDKMITETMSFLIDGNPMKNPEDNITMGCANINKGIHSGDYSGILGLGRGRYSLISQLKVSSFSFCLSGPNFMTASTLDLFYTGLNKNTTIIAPLLLNQFNSSFYYIGFKGISLNDKMVPIPSSYWDIIPNSSQGVIMDSGSFLTSIPINAYKIFRKRFLEFTTNNMILADLPIDIFDTCFSTSPLGYRLPEVKFHFTDTSSLTLMTLQVFEFFPYQDPITKEEELVACLAFVPNYNENTIIGSKLLQGTRQTFDLVHMNIKFTPKDCY
jgi:hypothetical protein